MTEDVLKKRIPICEAIGEFVNGRFEGDLTYDYFQMLVDRFHKYRRQVPIYNLVGIPGADHPDDLDSMVPVGWVEDLILDGSWLMADVTLRGEGAALVRADRVRGASIGTKLQKAYTGEMIGEVLEHLVLTNNPYIKGMNVAARGADGAGPVVYRFTAITTEATMADENKDKGMKPPADEAVAVALKEQEETIISLKAQTLRQAEEIETLTAQLANAKADVDKESALVENVNLKRKDFLRDVRAIVEFGLHKGTLLASECDGYGGNGPLDFTATERWLKGSKFYDAAMPNAEQNAFQVLSFMALKTKPRVTVGARFNAGAPLDTGAMTLTQDEKERVRKLGLDPERVANMKDDTNFEEWKTLPTQARA